MQRQALLTSKGQITIPRDIRKLLGVQAGDRLSFDVSESGIQVKPVPKKGSFEKYRGIGNPGLASGRRALIHAFRELRGR